jgi:hypothetical protein
MARFSMARETDPEFGRYQDSHKKAVDEMRRLLELEGYIYKNSVLLIPHRCCGASGQQRQENFLSRSTPSTRPISSFS